ncbi:Deoxycytidylate deaminase [Schistosoma japonicum]|uniref:dCMP deaminase n=1 Tax=Schistosoma japonicum TaxID=6182 RepID=A0A4Z2CX15_SCHJA|nr:Deoxycytidylate deaminase [Schistosoma japonicum]KAH8861229.1 Deoxycytidylate deaminase [Schistosoma japonicum]KAH8861230.1 Deoxycytidylate deaminase [Schistosoma japonicum]KAH8861231.1 Deoxycytidylate deaminase [Schistosoma japonicum]TNN08796.1 Deoxycytidylate deaminase [Schistosoma japonicum]
MEDKLQNLTLNGNQKRSNYISWDEYFMSIALLSAMRSKDPSTQVGACIVNDEKKIVGIGYNGMPNGVSDDDVPWGKESVNELENKYLYVCHAELNAVLNRNEAHSRGCTLYSTMFPCNECAKVIIQAGIKEVVYHSDKKNRTASNQAAKYLFKKAGISMRKFTPTNRTITINLN